MPLNLVTDHTSEVKSQLQVFTSILVTESLYKSTILSEEKKSEADIISHVLGLLFQLYL